MEENKAARVAQWYVERCKVGELLQSVGEVDGTPIHKVRELATELGQGCEFTNPDLEAPSIPTAAVFCSQCWLRTPEKDTAGVPKLYCFSVGDDEELIQTQEEEARIDSVHSEVEEAWGSVALSPDGSLIALLVQGHLQLQVVDTKAGWRYELPYQPDLSEVSQITRVFAVTRRGSREVSLAIQNGNCVLFLRVSKKGTGTTPFLHREIPEYKALSAAFLGQDILYVQPFDTGEGQFTCLRQYQYMEAGGESDGQNIPVFAPPPGVVGWDSHPVFAVDVTMLGGQTFVALLVARPSDGTECKNEKRSLLLASAGRKPEDWKWETPRDVEGTACSVNIVRDPFGKGGSLCVRVGTEQGGESIRRYGCIIESAHRPSRTVSRLPRAGVITD